MVESDDAAMGTRLHGALAFRIWQGLGGQTRPEEIKVHDDTESDLVDKAFQWVCELPRGFESRCLIEHSVMPRWGDEELFTEYGTLDLAIVDNAPHPDYLIDFKFGHEGPEPTMLYHQEGSYYLGLLGDGYTRQTKAMYHMPRTGEEGALDLDQTMAYDIYSGLSKLIHVANTATDLNPHPDGCQYCPCKPSCPALRETALEIVQEAAVGPLTIPQAKRIADISKALEDAVKASKALIKDTIRAGGEVEGYKLITKRGGRVLRSEAINRALIVCQKWGVSASEILGAGKFSLTRFLDGIVGKVQHNEKLKTKKEARKLAEDELEADGIIVQGPDREELRRVK
jgi:hypothetical protein